MQKRFLIAVITASCFICTGAMPAQAVDQGLIDAAKREGQAIWYTTLTLDALARPASDAFEKKYGIHVTAVRADNATISLRILNEGAAGKLQVDVMDGTAAATALQQAGYILKWQPEAAARLDKQYVDPRGYWTATNIYVVTPSFNTDLVPKGSEPKTYDDLLDPKWQGKMAWSAPSATYQTAQFIGLTLAARGEERGRAYLQKLGKQRIVEINGITNEVLNQVVAGEYPIGLMTFNNQTTQRALQGAPVAWIPMEPAHSSISAISVTRGPHQSAGKLFVEFLTSTEGQRLFRDSGYIPVDPDVKPLHPEMRPDGVTFKALVMTPEAMQDSLSYWKGIYDEYFH